MTDVLVPALDLHDGTAIPQLGFGVFQVPPAETAATVQAAFDAGYRHIDTAQMYGNEAGVGEAIAGSGLPRESIYVTTKLNNTNHAPADVRRSLEESLEKLRLDSVDLFLIHWPLPTQYGGDYVSTWRAMAQARDEGLVRSIGVSNFNPDHLDRIVEETGEKPVVNQVEAHPYFINNEVREATLKHDGFVEAWSPIAQGKVLDDRVIGQIAEKYGKTASQITLRWHLDRGDIVFPKTMSPERMAENIDVFDFELAPDDIAEITALDQGPEGRIGPDPATFDWIPD